MLYGKENTQYVKNGHMEVRVDCDHPYVVREYYKIKDLEISILYLQNGGYDIVYNNNPTLNCIHAGENSSFGMGWFFWDDIGRNIHVPLTYNGDDGFYKCRYSNSEKAYLLYDLFFNNENKLVGDVVKEEFKNHKERVLEVIGLYKKYYGDEFEFILFKLGLEKLTKS